VGLGFIASQFMGSELRLLVMVGTKFSPVS